MRLSRVFVLLGCMIFAISCAQLTHANHGKADPSAAASTAANANGNPFICTHSSCDDTDASRALDAALDRCSNTRNIYEKQASPNSRLSLHWQSLALWLAR